jgi:hypothetical protein
VHTAAQINLCPANNHLDLLKRILVVYYFIDSVKLLFIERNSFTMPEEYLTRWFENGGNPYREITAPSSAPIIVNNPFSEMSISPLYLALSYVRCDVSLATLSGLATKNPGCYQTGFLI